MNKEVGSQKKGGFLKKALMENFPVGVKNSKFSLTSWRAEEDVGESNVLNSVASKIGIKLRVIELRIQTLSYRTLKKGKYEVWRVEVLKQCSQMPFSIWNYSMVVPTNKKGLAQP